jgi:hypothetical protein
VRLADVAHIWDNPNDLRGRFSLVATVFVPKGTLIEYSGTNDFPNADGQHPHSCNYMNDGDFVLPTDYSFISLRQAFAVYSRRTVTNVGHFGKGAFVALRDIQVGDELTRRYPDIQWMIVLRVHLENLKPYVNANTYAFSLQNLMIVINERGYEMRPQRDSLDTTDDVLSPALHELCHIGLKLCKGTRAASPIPLALRRIVGMH